MYEKYFSDIVKTINDQVQKKWPGLTHPQPLINIFDWAAIHAQELHYQEHKLDAELNELWHDNPLDPPLLRGNSEIQNPKSEFEEFKAKVLAWGRVSLAIYKKFAENAAK